MNDFYRNNLVTTYNTDLTDGVTNVKHIDDNGQVVNSFYDNEVGSKDVYTTKLFFHLTTNRY